MTTRNRNWNRPGLRRRAPNNLGPRTLAESSWALRTLAESNSAAHKPAGSKMEVNRKEANTTELSNWPHPCPEDRLVLARQDSHPFLQINDISIFLDRYLNGALLTRRSVFAWVSGRTSRPRTPRYSVFSRRTFYERAF